MFDFSRKNRLTSKQDFQSVFRGPSKKASSRYLLALYQPNHLIFPRLGIVLPKNKAKHAVMRVSMRRLIRESFRHQKDLLKGLDIIVLLRTECKTLDKKLFREQVDQLWRQINP